MKCKNLRLNIALLILTSAISIDAYAAAFTFNFTGECDDCAFSGSPSDPGFDPFNDGLTQSVKATLTLSDVFVTDKGLIEYRGSGKQTFEYFGSSLINPFTISQPYLFTTDLLPTGQVQAGETFKFSSSANDAFPGVGFKFPDFYTALGEELFCPASAGGDLGATIGCPEIGLVSFELDSLGNWAIFGDEASDIGSGGQFTVANTGVVPEPAIIILFATGLLGFSLTRRKKT